MVIEVWKNMSMSLAKMSRKKSKHDFYKEDIEKDSRLMELLESYHKVSLKDNNEFAEKLTWCLENCQSKFRDIKHGNGVYWYFQNEQDATMFAMRWA